jgi:hypothetical protein
MIFVRYEIDTKGYQFWDPSAQSLIVAHNVTFNENSFPRRESGTCEPEPIEANPPIQPEPTPDPDPNDLFSRTGDQDDRPLYNSMNHPHHQPVPDNHQNSDNDDNLYYDPNAKASLAANPDEPRFIMGPPAPSRPSNNLPQQTSPAHLQQTRHNLEDREATKQWLDQHYPP